MPIVQDGFRTYTVTDEQDLIQEQLKYFDLLSPEEKSYAIEIMSSLNRAGGHDWIYYASMEEYERYPVSMDEFLTNSDYLGEVGRSIYTPWKKDLIELFGSRSYTNAIFLGSLGSGKSTISTICILRMLYDASCLKEPALTYGLAPGSNITLAVLAPNERVARETVFEQMFSMMRQSPYFTDVFPPLNRVKERFKSNGLQFRKNLNLIAGSSTDSSILGKNLIGAFIDELNFFQKEALSRRQHTRGNKYGADTKAGSLYDKIMRRMKSRFLKNGKMPGMLIAATSKGTEESIAERIITEAFKKQDTNYFIRDRSVIDLKKDQFSDKKFKVLVGNEKYRSRILEDKEYETTEWEDDARFIDIPEDLKPDFEADVEQCLTGDTKIPLLDGTEVCIKDLVGRNEFWVYSYDTNGSLHSGRGYDARLTIKNAPIYGVKLDSGEVIKATANHPFMMRDGTYKSVSELQPKDSLMPLYRRYTSAGYELVKLNTRGSYGWVATHKILAMNGLNNGIEFDKNSVIHHKDRNARNNSPDNLELMTRDDHINEHRNDMKSGIHPIHSVESKDKSTKARREMWKKARQEDWMIEHIKRSSIDITRYNKSDAHRAVARKMGNTVGIKNLRDPEIAARAIESSTKRIIEMNKEDNPMWSDENRKIVSEKAKKRMNDPVFKEAHREKIKQAYNDGKFEHLKVARWKGPHKYHVLKGKKNEKCPFCFENHKVVSVEFLGYEDVYDISVEKYNNFALSAGVVVHNSLRDLAGISTVAMSTFFKDPQKIRDCIDETRTHPFVCASNVNVKEWDSYRPYTMNWSELSVRDNDGVWKPKHYPHVRRHVHLDPGLTNDAFAIAIGCIAGLRKEERESSEHKTYIDYHPIFHIDFMLRIVGKPGMEVNFQNVRNFLYTFCDHGFSFGLISTDTFQCLSGDTKIKLLDGRDASMLELVNEYGMEKEFWVYAFDGNRIVPGKARNARKTGELRKTLIVEIDNGEQVKCTPEHPWMLRDGSWRLAKDLKPGDSLMPLYSRESVKNSSAAMDGYEEVYQPMIGSWELTHRMVGRMLWKNIKGKVIHHKGKCLCTKCRYPNFCKKNNSPESLELMSHDDHRKMHGEIGRTSLNNFWKKYKNLEETSEEKILFKEKLRKNLLKNRASPEAVEKLRKIGTERLNKINQKRWSKKEERQKQSERINKWNDEHKGRNHPRWKAFDVEKAIEYIKLFRSIGKAANALGMNRNCFRLKIKEYGFSTKDLSSFCNKKNNISNDYVIELYKNGVSQKEISAYYNISICSVRTRICRYKKQKILNHKVKKITEGPIEDVYDIEVDEYHNFALSSGVFVHNSREMCQALEANGFKTKVVSVDESREPYEYFQSSINNKRVSYYRHEHFLDEIVRLEDNGLKIDHLPGRSKDICDAIAGVVFTLSQTEYWNEPLVIEKGIDVDKEKLKTDPDIISSLGVTNLAPGEDAPKEMIKFYKKKPKSLPPTYNKDKKLVTNNAIDILIDMG